MNNNIVATSQQGGENTMKLINADAENGRLLDFIVEHDTGIQYAIEHKDRTVLEGIFSEYFKEQKIAYDVDKVVERLKRNFKKYYGPNWDKAPYLVRAIEIVREGGINE